MFFSWFLNRQYSLFVQLIQFTSFNIDKTPWHLLAQTTNLYWVVRIGLNKGFWPIIVRQII
jgi:hypothetical protein